MEYAANVIFSPTCYDDAVLQYIAESYELTIEKLEGKVCKELDEKTKSVNPGAGSKTYAKAIEEGMIILDTGKDHTKKLGHRSILIFLDANGKCSEWYHFDSDTSQGCKYAIKAGNNKLVHTEHPLAKRHVKTCLDYLALRVSAMQKKRSSDDTATDDVAGATDDATNAAIAKRRKKQRKVSSEKPIFAVLKKWENAHKTKFEMSAAGRHMYELFGLQLLTIDPQGTTVEIYYGWSDDEKRRMIASTHALTDLELVPGLPPGYEPPFKCEIDID
jgi:hypothetical protein